ncbi:MAG: mechanosensitive ion channel [Methanobrevibacter sp.]|nr:mechanosensitive ion channel [Methanobrevibacter sp.]
MSKYIIAVIALILIFNIFGIDLKGIFISIGIVGIAISFAAKDIISNFMSGFFLIADKTLEIGDVMQINNLKGEVKKIGLRNTVILTETGDTIIIPNSSLSTNPYSRFKKGEIEKVSLNVTAPLNIDISDFKNEIEEIINKNEGILKTPKPKIESKGIDENGTLLKIMFWVKNFNKKEDNKLIITNQVREIINKKLGDDN